MIFWIIVGAVLGYGAVRLLGRYPRAPERLAVLTRGEARLIEVAAEALYPEGGAIPTSGLQAGIPAYVDRWLAALPVPKRVLIRGLLVLVEHATLLWPAPPPLGRRRFSSLGLAERTEVLEGWRASRFFPRRLVFTSLRAILTMGYFGNAAVLRSLGLAPKDVRVPVGEADLLYPRVGEERPPVTRADLTPPSDGTPLDPDGPLHPLYLDPSQ